MATKTILIVEDQDYLRRMLREFLESALPEYNIIEAADGASALMLVQKHSPPLVLMDIGLPDGNGIDLTKQIKAMIGNTAVIIVSSHRGNAYIEQAQAAGAFSYIVKDRINSDLLPAIDAAFACIPTKSGQKDQQ